MFKRLFLTGMGLFLGLWVYADKWIYTGSMSVGRGFFTQTLLNNGKVLVTGGRTGSTITATCEVYDAATGTWTQTSSLSVGRGSHTATLLLDGRVLVAGGPSLSSCELYDPGTGNWSGAASLNTTKARHTATLINNGKVLVIGGESASGVLSSCEVYNAANGTWTGAGGLSTGRYLHTAVLLQSGKVLVIGGKNSAGNAIASCEIYNPSTDSWSACPSLHTARYDHTATLLLDGRVLVAGGMTSSANTSSSCEVFDPITGLWDTTGSMNSGRAKHGAVLLPHNGKVLVIGGGNGSNYFSTCELYDTVNGVWELTDTLNSPRRNFGSSLLPDGRVLAVGGGDVYFSPSCELYMPSDLSFVYVLAPNGGEVWQVNSTKLVKWLCYHSSLIDHYILLYTTNYDWQIVPDSILSPHPYPNNYDSTWIITHPGATKILVHFDTLLTEWSYDYVIIYGSNGDSITAYTGLHSDFWTPEVLGDTVKIRLISNASTNTYGFDVDKYSYYHPGIAVWDTIAINVSPGDTTYSWIVPVANSQNCRVKIQAFDTLNTLICEDVSDSNFTISTTGVNESSITNVLTVLDNHPNPFTHETIIQFILQEAAQVTLSIYDILGQKKVTLLSEYKEAGSHIVKWGGAFSNGDKAPSGIYFYFLRVGESKLTRKLIRL